MTERATITLRANHDEMQRLFEALDAARERCGITIHGTMLAELTRGAHELARWQKEVDRRRKEGEQIALDR